MKQDYTITTAASGSTPVFPLKAGAFLTIHHAAAGSSPSGTWTLEVFNEADETWDEIAEASGEFTNPSGSDAGGVANYSNPYQGRGRVTYTRTSGGETDGGIVIVYQEASRN